ncbi:SRPBCC domain-containing protein [Paenibacillus athensensis]|uniref:SRPBCC domain-containing protein n=1 Tax=Paenibacillus athensensis TaxID=1967502 RepID=UPI001E44FF3A|nr:SRPBCC domain-containing protein [Paenibacillus athensensis]
MPRWWGPAGFTTTTVREISVKPGGIWRYVMHGPDGVDYNNQIVYEEIVNPEKLVYAHGSGGDADDAFHVVVTFDEQDGGTVLNMTTTFRTAAELEQAIANTVPLKAQNRRWTVWKHIWRPCNATAQPASR